MFRIYYSSLLMRASEAAKQNIVLGHVRPSVCVFSCVSAW